MKSTPIKAMEELRKSPPLTHRKDNTALIQQVPYQNTYLDRKNMALLRIVCREQASVRDARFIRTNNVKAEQPINFSYRSDQATTWNHELSNIYINNTVLKAPS